MIHQNLIKVIKRVKRERMEQEATVRSNAEPSAQEKLRALAATVEGWVNESRQTRLARHIAIKQQLGWQQGESHNSLTQVISGSSDGVK